MRNVQIIKYVRMAAGLMVGGVLFFLCVSCFGGNEPLRGAELCEQIHVAANSSDRVKKIDSLVGLSVELSSDERYAVLFHALQMCSDKMEYESATRYLRRLDSLPFPEVSSPAVGLLLLGGYENKGYNPEYAPRQLGTERLASLLFDIENRWNLTQSEKLRLLVAKSGIYFNVFKEYKSALIIAMDGIRLARECHVDQKTLADLHRVLFQSLYRLSEDDPAMTGWDDFIEFAETFQFDSTTKVTINTVIGGLYEQRGDYRRAYDWLTRSGKGSSDLYYPPLTRVYVGMDSIQMALSYIEEKRRNNPHPLVLAAMAWDEACIRQQIGDEAGYDRCLRESLELSDRFPRARTADNYAPSEAYAWMLWQQGKRSEAIRRMETVRDNFISESKVINLTTIGRLLPKWLDRSRILRDYYISAGRMADAHTQSLLCDSLGQLLTDACIQAEKRKATTTIYTMDLGRNLELRAVEFQQERQKLYFTYFVLGIVLLAGVILWVLYRQREQQLNVLYARQKELEQLQAEKQRLVTGKDEKLSLEEQLFRKLEQQFYEEELFRNPGFSRDDLCRLGGSNRMYVSTCINKYAGTNINQWINKARIDYAIRLIGEGERDLAKLSEQSGFSSIKSFFRNFRQFTNLTPRQYIVRDRQIE